MAGKMPAPLLKHALRRRFRSSIMPSGLVFNIQKYCVHDGPGIRTTVFLKGCPLCCVWCHNPEGVSPKREIVVVESRCIVCGECRRACPFAAAIAADAVLPTRSGPCTLCGECVEACPTGARQVVGREMTVAEVMREVQQDRIFYEDSSGGVTFSGGEPLLQPDFLLSLLGACRARGLHTAVDTCGFGCTDHLLAVARLTNLFLFDLKFMDDAKHRQYCGVPNAPILENLRRLDQIHDNIWLRVPVIPGVNDAGENLEAIARFAVSIHGVRQVNLLPYHKTGLQKFRRLGQSYRLEEVPQPAAEQMEKAVNTFRTFGLAAKAGG
jgi:pyruvate formate lyase activating enzyme